MQCFVWLHMNVNTGSFPSLLVFFPNVINRLTGSIGVRKIKESDKYHINSRKNQIVHEYSVIMK